LNEQLAREVWRRAEDRCEYCRIPAALYPLPFQLDHIIARQHGGLSDAGNLALACLHCNRHKGPNIAGRDPLTGAIVGLFHPRNDRWNEHFRFEGPIIFGLTARGRATIQVLAMNTPDFVDVREALIAEGTYTW